MNTNQSKPSATKRTQYSPQFKEQAVERANRDGVPKVEVSYSLDGWNRQAANHIRIGCVAFQL